MTVGPVPSSEGVSLRMSRARRRDTEPEMLVRREAFRRGLRYRVDAPLPGMPRRRADMVFPGRKVAVFVDGPVHQFEAVAERDTDAEERLRDLGWDVVRFPDGTDWGAIAGAYKGYFGDGPRH